MTSCQTLAKTANQLRLTALRMIHDSASGHPGGSLSSIDIITALYCGGILRHDPKKPNLKTRDYFVLSKGHASAALYAVLAERGFFPAGDLSGFRQAGSHLQGHPTPKTPGVEIATGSLGQGLSFAVGLALGAPAQHVFTLLGDGECQEGQVWEAAMSAPHFGLGNLTVIVDQNGLQIDGATKDVMDVGDLSKKFKAFGWEVVKIDGHNLNEITDALKAAKKSDKPTAIIAKTVKGKGAPMAEGNFAYHGVPLTADEMAEVAAHLEARC